MQVSDIKPRITLREPQGPMGVIIKEVAEKHDLTIDQIKTPCRQRRYSWARHEAFDRIYRETNSTLPMIARAFAMDHTTVLYGIFAHRKRKAEGKAL